MFRVEIPAGRNDPVVIVEHYGYEGGGRRSRWRSPRCACRGPAWSGIAEAARHDFNERLRERKLPTEPLEDRPQPGGPAAGQGAVRAGVGGRARPARRSCR